jgi:hypothetical protein
MVYSWQMLEILALALWTLDGSARKAIWEENCCVARHLRDAICCDTGGICAYKKIDREAGQRDLVLHLRELFAVQVAGGMRMAHELRQNHLIVKCMLSKVPQSTNFRSAKII